MYDASYGMGLGYPDPLEKKRMESTLKVEEYYQKKEIDISKAVAWLEVSTNIKVDLQTQRMKIHFDEDKKDFYVMIPHVRVSTTDDNYRLRKLFEAEGFESEVWTQEGRIVKLRISFISLPSGRAVDIIIDENDCSGKGLRKAFRKEGLTMQISQQYEASLFEDVLYCLIDHASEKHVIFPHLGWNKLDGKWLFSSKNGEEVNAEVDLNTIQIGGLGISKIFKSNNQQFFFEAVLGYILHQAILRDMGLRLQTPVAVIYDTARTAEELKRFLSTFIPVKEADSYLTPKKLSQLIEKAHAEPVFYEAGAGRYNEENIAQLIKWARSGQLKGNIVDGFPILFFSAWLPNQWQEQMLVVNVCEEELNFLTYGYSEKIWIKALGDFLPQQIGQVREEVRSNFTEEKGNLKVLLSAYLMNTFLFRQPLEAELCRATDAISTLLADEGSASVNGIQEVFIDNFYEWAMSMRHGDCFQRSGSLDDANLNRSILYDEAYVYLPENIFSQIIRPLKAQVSSLEIKAALKEEGVLVCQNSEGYTINLLLNLPNGFVKHRFYRLDRQAIKKTGELEIVGLCELYKNS